MDTRRFVRESPVGLGWLMGHMTTEEAVRETARLWGVPVQAVRDDYFTETSKEEGPIDTSA